MPPYVDQFLDPPPAVVGNGRTWYDASQSSRLCGQMGFTYVNSNSDCPKNTGLGFAKCEEATGVVPSVARRRAFRR